MPKHTLMAHQKEGVKFLKKVNGVGALLWDPGVGKTGATAAYFDHLAKKYGEVRVLVVAPLTAADTWVLQPQDFMDSAVKARMLEGRVVDQMTQLRQGRKWDTVPWTSIMSNHRGAGVSGNRVTILSMSAGGVSSYCDSRPKTVQMLQAVRKYAPHVIVMDESHIIKAPNSNISMAMYQIGQLAKHRIILTGTVNPKDLLDCYGQWRFLAPWTFSEQYGAKFTKKPHKMTMSQAASIRPWTWDQFKKRFGTDTGYKGKATKPVYDGTESILYQRVAERAHNVRKEDALDLPPVTDIDVHIRLDAHEQRLYDEMLSDLAAMLANGEMIEAPNALAKIMKLRQITAGFIRDTETEQVHAIGNTKQRAVAEVVNVRLHGEQRIVVFAYFKSECAALANMLKAKGRTVEVITGDTKKNERLAIRQRFADVSGNPEQIVLVAQQRTMSVSVNELVTAQNAVYASMSERRDDWVQSRGRLDRNGQVGQHVTFWNVYAPDTVDEVMLTTHKHRGNLEKALLDYIKSASK